MSELSDTIARAVREPTSLRAYLEAHYGGSNTGALSPWERVEMALAHQEPDRVPYDVVTPDGRQALVFTNALNQKAIALVDLDTGDMEGAKKHLNHYLEVAPEGDDASTAADTVKYL